MTPSFYISSYFKPTERRTLLASGSPDKNVINEDHEGGEEDDERIKSLAQKVRQKSDISERRSKG